MARPTKLEEMRRALRNSVMSMLTEIDRITASPTVALDLKIEAWKPLTRLACQYLSGEQKMEVAKEAKRRDDSLPELSASSLFDGGEDGDDVDTGVQ